MDLLQRLKNKETDALKKTVEIYTPYVATVIFNAAASLSKEDAEETAADVFAALWKNADLLDSEKGSIKSYLAGAARKAAAQKLRKQIPDPAPLEENYIGEVDLQEDIIEKESAESLWKKVMELGEPDNEIFVRYYKYGEKIREIAEKTGLRVGTVKTKLARGKKKLKEKLTESEGLL